MKRSVNKMIKKQKMKSYKISIILFSLFLLPIVLSTINMGSKVNDELNKPLTSVPSESNR